MGASCKGVCLVPVFDTLSGLIIVNGDVYKSLKFIKGGTITKKLKSTDMLYMKRSNGRPNK